MFLAGENFPGAAVAVLREQGFDVTLIAEDAPGSTDEAVLSRAGQAARTLVTLDKDFGELVFRRGLAAEHGVILFRLEAETPARLQTGRGSSRL